VVLGGVCVIFLVEMAGRFAGSVSILLSLQTGKSVGRIDEVRAEKRGDDVYVQAYLLGPYALQERLSLWIMHCPLCVC
jgi:hypothetical protein